MLKTPKLNFRLSDLMRAAWAIARVDGGFVIAMQIINFLLMYFGARVPLNIDGIPEVAAINATHISILMFSLLNTAVIIYRITGLARGIKYSAITCYQHALRRWLWLIILHTFGGLLLLRITAMYMHFTQNQEMLGFLVLSCAPIATLCAIYVIDQEQNAFRAIGTTISTIKDKISLRLLINLGMLYSLPFCLATSFSVPQLIAPYTGLFNAVWFLFCHILTIVVYASTIVSTNVNTRDTKPTKVIII